MSQELQQVKHFSIFYDADSKDLQQHSIGARELGEAVLAMATMVERADLLLNNHTQTVSLQVSARPKPGSFGFEFDLVTLVPAAIDVLKYLGFTTASLAVARGSALAVARQMKDRKVVTVHTSTGSDVVQVELDGEMIECDEHVAALVTDPLVRSCMQKVISKPLGERDSPVFKIMDGDEEVVRLVDEDTSAYTMLPRNSMLVEQSEIVTTNITFSRISFVSSSGWKMVYDGREVAVVMKDEAFMAAVRASAEQFSKDDMFEVELEMINKETALSFKTRYVIKQVLRHRVRRDKKLI
jgi:hypothetical protein